MRMKSRYLVKDLYTADPSAHVFEEKLFIYPSHDIESGVPENDNGDHFNMRDYHAYSMDDINGEITDHGVILDVDDVPWASRQMWDSDVACKDGKYYLYFSAKDKNDVFHLGVAVSDTPEGPFKAQTHPMMGSYSIDPCVYENEGEGHYIFFGGIWGGQLQRYRDNNAIECGAEPADIEDALCPKVARLSDDMLEFAEAPKDLLIYNENGELLRAGDHDRRFFEASWLHQYKGKYYFSYSTGNTHKLCYAISDNLYGPYTYQGVILTPVVGWTIHHSICEFKGKWYLFHHDSVPSGGKTWLRSMKVQELEYTEDGKIMTMDGMG